MSNQYNKAKASNNNNNATAGPPGGGSNASAKPQPYLKALMNRNRFKTTKFEGQCSELRGYVFDYGNQSALDNYHSSIKAVGNYVGSNYDYGDDIKKVILYQTMPNIQKPVHPSEATEDEASVSTMTKTDEYLWKKSADEYMKRNHTLRENVKKGYALMWGQCTDTLKDQLESLPTYDAMNKTSDVILLIHAMKQVIFKFDATKYKYQALEEAMLKWYRYYQTPQMSNVDFIEGIKTRVDVIEQCGGSVCSHPDLVTAEYQALMNANNGVAEPSFHHKAKEAVKNKHLGVATLVRADRRRYAKVMEDLENEYVKGQNNYPQSLVQAHHFLNNMKDRSIASRKARVQKDEAGVVFANVDRKGQKKQGVDKTDKTCFSCGQTGHYADDPECPNYEKTQKAPKTEVTQLNWMTEDEEYAFSFLNFTFVNTQDRQGLTNSVLDPEWILLDNQSSVDVFCNPNLLKDIHQVDTHVVIHCNAGTHTTDQQGLLPGYGWVWFSPDAIANILSLSKVAESHQITYDSTDGVGFVVHRDSGPPLVFRETHNGLFVHDTRLRSVLMVNTVDENAATFSVRDQVRAQTARELQHMMGNPSNRDFENIITHNLIRNIPVDVQDARNAIDIYGENIMSIRGRTTQRRSIPVDTDIIPVPSHIREVYGQVQLPTDVFFINGLPFAISVSRKINFTTVQVLQASTAFRLHKYLQHAIKFYSNRNFNVVEILADGQFEALREPLLSSTGVNLNVTAANEHVKEVERKIRVVKERVRGVRCSLPFTKIPIRMIVDLVYFCVLWLNGVPNQNGVSDTLSPRTIMTGTTLDVKKHCRVPFGAYCQVKEPTTNRTDLPRTIGCICLGPTGNRQGSYRFLNLATGRRITREQFTVLPVTEDIIQRVEQLAEDEGQTTGLEFRDRRRNLIEDSLNDSFFDAGITGDEQDAAEALITSEHAHVDNIPPPITGVNSLTTGIAPDEPLATVHEDVADDESEFVDSDHQSDIVLDDVEEIRSDEVEDLHQPPSPPPTQQEPPSHAHTDFDDELPDDGVSDSDDSDADSGAAPGIDANSRPPTSNWHANEIPGVIQPNLHPFGQHLFENTGVQSHLAANAFEHVSDQVLTSSRPSIVPSNQHPTISGEHDGNTQSGGDPGISESYHEPSHQDTSFQLQMQSKANFRPSIAPISQHTSSLQEQRSPQQQAVPPSQQQKSWQQQTVSSPQQQRVSAHEGQGSSSEQSRNRAVRDSRAHPSTPDARTSAKSPNAWTSTKSSQKTSKETTQEKQNKTKFAAKSGNSSPGGSIVSNSHSISSGSSLSSKWDSTGPTDSRWNVTGTPNQLGQHQTRDCESQRNGSSSESSQTRKTSTSGVASDGQRTERTIPRQDGTGTLSPRNVHGGSLGRAVQRLYAVTDGGGSTRVQLRGNNNDSNESSRRSHGRQPSRTSPVSLHGRHDDPSANFTLQSPSLSDSNSGFIRDYDSQLTIAPSTNDSVTSKGNQFLRDLQDGANELRDLREAIGQSWTNRSMRSSSQDESSEPDAGEVSIADNEEFIPPKRNAPSISRVHQTRYRKRQQELVDNDGDLEDHIVHVALTQLSWKAGLKTWGTRAEEAITKEFKQFHEFDCFRPVHSVDLTEKQKDETIKSLMFLKQKRCGRIKARTCADGRPQRELFSKQEVTSPTVQIESVLITAAIEATEGREVACVDIPGAFLQADMDDDVTMKLEGKLAELMARTVPSIYRPYVELTPNGKSVLYVKLKKAVYGCLKSALLFYKKLSHDLEEAGFKKNPYDPCVANMDVNGEQLTVTWHVDDLKISHKDPKVVDRMISWLSRKYGKVVDHRGKKHDYLGMDLDYSTPGVVKISMERYIKQTLEEFPDVINSTSATPAGSYLFSINEDSKLLPEEQAQSFHTAVARLLFVSGRARPDIKTVISFLTTRVKQPTEEDWIKLKRLLKYLNGTAHLTLNINADNINVNKWWIDGSYAVHPNMRSHTGASMSLGKGATTSASNKQKINTRSSTEAELVAVNDLMAQMMWTRYFIEAQGYKVDKTIVYQDNQSAILLEENGRSSSTKRTKHLNVRYFFIKDRIAAGEMEVQYCPTGEMTADFFTKPLQGSLFRKFRYDILNYQPDEDEISQECVGKIAKGLKRESGNELRGENRTAGVKSDVVETSP